MHRQHQNRLPCLALPEACVGADAIRITLKAMDHGAGCGAFMAEFSCRDLPKTEAELIELVKKTGSNELTHAMTAEGILPTDSTRPAEKTAV